jgi:LytS/YehU family sensor histidine kinase
METIEQEPKTAAALVESLAGEFRILSRVAGEKLIPLAQEVELCRAHLRVMSLRKGVTCSLNTTAVDGRALVPPALFHTLVENGLTHLQPREGRQDFELRMDEDARRVRYTLLARGIRPVESTRAADPARESAKEGTGLRYVKARLEESFTGRWQMTAGPVPDGWRTEIEITSAGDTLVSRLPDSTAPALSTRRPA